MYRRYRVVRIDGSTNIEERQNIVDNFNLRGVGQVRRAEGGTLFEQHWQHQKHQCVCPTSWAI